MTRGNLLTRVRLARPAPSIDLASVLGNVASRDGSSAPPEGPGAIPVAPGVGAGVLNPQDAGVGGTVTPS